MHPPEPHHHDPHPPLLQGCHHVARESSHQSDAQAGPLSESEDEEGDLSGDLQGLDRAESEPVLLEQLQSQVGFPPRVRSMEQQVPSQSLRSRPQSSVCVNCEGRFRSSKMHQGGRLCANCNKIFLSVESSVERFGGSFKMVVRRLGKVELVLSCAQGHSWVIGMQSKRAKNGCRQCKDLARAEEARR